LHADHLAGNDDDICCGRVSCAAGQRNVGIAAVNVPDTGPGLAPVVAANLFFWWTYLPYLLTVPAETFALRPRAGSYKPQLLFNVMSEIVPRHVLSPFFVEQHLFEADPLRATVYYLSLALGAPLAAYGLWRWIRAPLTLPVLGIWWWLIGVAFDVRATTTRRIALTVAAAMFVLTAKAVSVVADIPGELNRAGILNRPGALSERVDDLTKRLQQTMPQGSHVPSRNSEALRPFYAYVERCTSPRDRLVMTGLQPDVFVLANRGFAGGQMAYRPAFYASEKDQRKAIARMQAQSVPLVIVALEEESGFRGALPLVAAYVDEHYEPLAMIPVPDTRGLQIYIERGRRAVSPDTETGWPCLSRSS